MVGLLALSIGIGLAVSLMFSELFGLVAGGMVVPGYIALQLSRPVDIALTLGAAFATFALVRAISSVVIVYGRRRTVLMILVGYVIGALVRSFASGIVEMGTDTHYTVIGFIVPGLIAIWLDRQGVTETLCSLIIASAVVRLILVLVLGPELQI